MSPKDWKPGAFYVYAIAWITLLCLLALGYSLETPLSWLPHAQFGFTEVLPLWVPWAGALGGATISLVGVTDHSAAWEGPKYAYWHLARPALGAVFGVIGVLAIVLVLQAVSPAAKDNVYTAQGIGVLAVFSFLLGYREETFRELVKRLVDTLVKPAAPAVPTFVTLAPATVDLGTCAVSSTAATSLTLVNRASKDIDVTPADIAISGTNDVTHGVAAPFTTGAGTDSTIPLTWTPSAPGPLSATVTVTAGATSVTARLTGTAT
ncbi:MAG TPA: hypothetical protein VFL38_02825 [Humibacillus xanthopallidus]|nr:hypothetical protein [Humibacillus xanthopallidus]